MKEEVCGGKLVGCDRQAASILGSHPLASQQHISADLGTGVGFHAGCGALYTTDTINSYTACL